MFNLGGPKTAKNVRPFLYNLFSDPQIIKLPSPFRQILAQFISISRSKFAKDNYSLIPNNPAGGSPLLKNTKLQAEALERVLLKKYPNAKTFIAMRYWNPTTTETIKQIKKFNPDKIVLLPLYPQYSTTTTESSLRQWKKLAPAKWQVQPVCCWWNEPNFIKAHNDLLSTAIKNHSDKENYHVLFSAHGIPENLVKAGDPYQKQIEACSKIIAQTAKLETKNWSIAYQSRVGRLKWLTPEIGSEIKRLAKTNQIKTIFIVPISFVSEHVETLVELDIEFKQIALKAGIKKYIRIDTLGTHAQFIASLQTLIDSALASDKLLCPDQTPCTKTY